MTDIATLLTDLTDTVEEKTAATRLRVAEIGARMDELEQKSVRVSGDGNVTPASWGHEFTGEKAMELKGLERERGRVQMQLKTVLSSGTGDPLIVPTRDLTIGSAQRRLTIRNLLNTVRVTSGSVEYPEVVAGTRAADMVAEGELKPEAALTLAMRTVPIRTIAHWIPASLQVLDDVPQLQSLIDVELRYGLALKEEQQLVRGDGTGQNVAGLATRATAYVDPIGMTTPNGIDTIGAAILQASLTDIPPDGVVLHPADWWKMRMLKDADGNYILGAPGAPVAPSLFGLPVVATQAMAAGEFLVGAFSAQTLYDRWEARVDVSTEHADFFVRNLCAVRCEERIGLALKRPEAIIHGTFPV